MKVLLAIVIVMSGVLSLQAQDHNGSKKKVARKEAANKLQKSEDAGGGDADMVRLQVNEVPRVLRKTLESGEYPAGWDQASSSIYGSEQNDLFVVEINQNNQSRTFYFDGDGKPIKY